MPEAERGFIRLSSLYARSLDISLEDAVGEQAEALRERRVEVLTDAVSKTMSQINSIRAVGLDDMSEAQKAEMTGLMLDRGRMLLDLGSTQEDGTFSFEQAIQILEEVVFTVGEGTPASLRAYDLLGQVYAARQDTRSARDYFEAVIEMAIPSGEEDWDTMVKEQELTQADKEKRWLFVELSTEGLVNAYLAMGDTAQASKYALHMYNTWKREGFQLSPQLGYPSLLAAARALLESGGWIGGDTASGDARWYASEDEAKEAGASKRNRISTTDLALQIAQQVNKENQGNVLQIRAQKLISSIIDRPGVVVAPSVLYEAAEGDYNERNNEEALAGFRRVLRALDGQDDAARYEYCPRIYFRMGRTYIRMERSLEAALAFQEGCTKWVGDPEYDSQNATSFYRAMQDVVRESPGDANIKELMDAAEKIAAELSNQSGDALNFSLGRKAERNEDYAAAIKYYNDVQQGSLEYEIAQVNIAICKLKTGQVSEALELLDAYLDTYVKDPKNDPGSSQAKAAKRGDAMAKAEFYRGQIHFKVAQKSQGRVDVPEAELQALFQKVIDLVADYHARYPEQTSFSPITMWSVMTSYLVLDDTAAARKLYDELAEGYPDSPYTAKAAVDLYNALKGLQESAVAAGEVDRGDQLLREMAELLEFGNKGADEPEFTRLRLESKHWLDLGEDAKAEVALERLQKRFGASTDPEVQADMTKYVLPDLAHALLRQHKVTEAHAILLGLMDQPEGKPTKRTVLDYCRAVTGWVEGDAGKPEVVPGAGQTEEEFQRATDTLFAIAKSVESKWTCEWYAYQFQLAWGYYAWATQEWSPNKDSRKKDQAERTLKVLVGSLGPQFKGKEGATGIGESCESADPEERRMYGDDKLRSRFAWLWGKVQ